MTLPLRSTRRVLAILVVGLLMLATGCRPKGARLEPKNQTFAELRAVRRGVHVTPPSERARAPYARERLSDGALVSVDAGGLAWLRRDGGTTLLIAGPAELTLRAETLICDLGSVFVDTLGGGVAEIDTPRGALHLSGVRASLTVSKGAVDAYVLQGEVKTESGVAAGPGDGLHIGDGKAEKHAVLTWEDWTGGLATTDQTAEPAPFGIGTVGARSPGAQGQARFPLSIQKLEVRATIDHDLAITEVDEVFFNPSAETVEGIYRFRTPAGATLHRFGVDRDGELVWGRVKEKAAAAAQYQSNVYAGSTEDPALLEWDAPGVYAARLYPIPPGGTRRVVTRYAEWLTRQGDHGERRLYVYPMAAEGAEASLPRIEELKVQIDLAASGARSVRTGMHGIEDGSRVIVRGYDVVPRADLAIELFDAGEPPTTAVAFRAKHRVEPELMPLEDAPRAKKEGKNEKDYLLVPVRPSAATEPPGGLDVAVVVDTSAATEPSSLAIARVAMGALMAHLGKDDRAAVWASDAVLRPVAEGSGELRPVDAARRDAIAAGLTRVERGGATDLGAVLAEAASRLDPNRRGVVVYIGDGKPTVGELVVADLRDRLDRLPRPTRLFAIGVGQVADLGILKGVARGGFAERVVDGYGAARASIRLLEEAERPVWLGVKVDLGVGVDRVYPRELGALFADETALVVGRLTGEEPRKVVVTGSQGTDSRLLTTVWMADDGDLRRRWAEGRLAELLDSAAGRAAVVEVGVRFGVLTPFTSYYVPTAREHAAEQSKNDAEEANADNKEGGTGTRAKGEEGSMGKPMAAPAARTTTAMPAASAAASPLATQDKAALREAASFGMIGLLDNKSAAAPQPPASVPMGSPTATAASGSAYGDAIGDSFGSGGLGLSGVGEGGGGKDQGIGLGGIGTIGHGAGLGTGQGFGNGHGRLGGGHKTAAPSIRQGATQVNGRLPAEVIQRIARQNFGRFRLCYENGLRTNPNLAGGVTVKFVIDKSGAVATATDGGSNLPDTGVVSCVVRGFSNLSFPQPEGGIVTVVYPIIFNPGDPIDDTQEPKAKKGTDKAVTVALAPGAIGWTVRMCDPSADQPLEDRVILWSERLVATASNVDGVAAVYASAVDRCEAPTWPERTRLLGLMLDVLPSVAARVSLWRALFNQKTAANVLYRGILSRVHTTAQIRELHDALGLKRIDPTTLAATLAKEKTPEAKAKKLVQLAAEWPDDLELALRLLDAYEDAGDSAGARALARQLRRREDANARVRTAVGEAYLRLAKAPGGTPADEAEARRAFGEIVEFAPDDPVARRRLGDLLRSHGWYDEAFRQYETLAKLTPSDASISLLLAAASAGMGRVEQAVGWTEKAGGSGAPDGSDIGPLAKDFAAIYLAWARADALHAGRTAEVTALRERARGLSPRQAVPPGGATARAFLTWNHPEVHPVLWSNARGSASPARGGDALFGLAEVSFPVSRSDVYVELRFEPEEAERAARLGAEATLTVLYNEATEDERIVVVPITLRPASNVRRFLLAKDGAHEEALK
jgi:hypothetical protein